MPAAAAAFSVNPIYASPFKSGAYTPRRTKALLLDLDGVVFHHPAASEMVKDSVEKYIGEHLQIAPEKATHINKYLYKTYGHTLLGLEHMFPAKSHPPTNRINRINEFNSAIYNPQMMLLAQYLATPERTLAIGHQVNELIARAADNGIPTYLYSNAPLIWCQWACWLLRLSNRIPMSNMITSDHLNGGYLKPEPISYKFVDVIVPMDDMLFIDDSLINLFNLPSNWSGFQIIHHPINSPALSSFDPFIPFPPMSPETKNLQKLNSFEDMYPYL